MALASALLTVMIDAVRKTARPVLRDFGEVANLQTSRKGTGDFVTAADIKAGETLFELLTKARPGYGFLGGAKVHLVEPFLCDPLLMRLPLQDRDNWRIGHFKRRIPEGYLETLASGENRIHHPALEIGRAHV